jgi:hypothetical protein
MADHFHSSYFEYMAIRMSITTLTKHLLLAFIFLPAVLFFSFLFVSMHVAFADEVTLAWDPNPEPSVQGYRVYYGKSSGLYTSVVDAGNNTDSVIMGLEAGTTYYFACTAYSATGDESNFSNEIVYTTQGGSSGSSGSSGTSAHCFIATAAYGSGLAQEVTVLREFRDRYLLTNHVGQAFVDFYYRVSPPIAAFISEHEMLKMAARLGLTPLVYGIKYPFLLFGGVGCIVCILVGRRHKR